MFRITNKELASTEILSKFAYYRLDYMKKTFNIYCDESTHLPNDGCPFMLLGYICVPYPLVREGKNAINDIKNKYGFIGEMKWSNINQKTEPMYEELIEFFFRSNLKFRAVVVRKSEIDDTRPGYTFNDFYFRMYYQLLHHPMEDTENTYNVYFDIKDTCSHLKLRRLKEILGNSSNVRNFQFMKSYESQFIQLADVIMGAVNYNLRMEEDNIPGQSVAKKKVVETIKRYSNLSLIRSTYKTAEKFNLFFIKLK